MTPFYFYIVSVNQPLHTSAGRLKKNLFSLIQPIPFIAVRSIHNGFMLCYVNGFNQLLCYPAGRLQNVRPI